MIAGGVVSAPTERVCNRILLAGGVVDVEFKLLKELGPACLSRTQTLLLHEETQRVVISKDFEGLTQEVVSPLLQCLLVHRIC